MFLVRFFVVIFEVGFVCWWTTKFQSKLKPYSKKQNIFPL